MSSFNPIMHNTNRYRKLWVTIEGRALMMQINHLIFHRYNNGPQPPTLQPNQRFGSQSSLQQQQQQQQQLFHATPRLVGTPQSSAGTGPTRLVSVGSALTPTGPEKPQRTYEEKARSISQGNPPRGVRFQDPKEAEKVRIVYFWRQVHWSLVLICTPYLIFRSMTSILTWNN